ncbi:sterol carrier protein 2 [Pseudogymnoascus sp. 24MN13]|nr:sterol carrier protein 2 [Pseudogymnoascus sp. 24MN13]
MVRSAPSKRCYVLGVGMTKFIKPRGKVDYTELGFEAGVKAMPAAQVTYDDVDQGVACYCYGDSTCGQRVFYQFGMTQIPIYNVNNNCSTGSTGLHIGRDVISNGGADCVLVIGFEKMNPGSLQSFWNDRENPTGTNVADAGIEYMEKYGASNADFAEITRVNHEHSQRNPYSQFQQVAALPLMEEPAAVLVSEEFLNSRPHLRSQAVLIAGQALTTDAPSLFNRSSIDLMGYDMSKAAAEIALRQDGRTTADVQVVELHDCFSANEMVTIDALGLSEKGKAHELVRNGDITYGGKYVINPSGGLISKGHPLAPPVALQHNLGLGGAAVVTVYERADGQTATKVSDEEVGKINGLGYNPAVVAKGFTAEQASKVRSKNQKSAWALGEAEAKVLARF